jgi:hypothetical protein
VQHTCGDAPLKKGRVFDPRRTSTPRCSPADLSLPGFAVAERSPRPRSPIAVFPAAKQGQPIGLKLGAPRQPLSGLDAGHGPVRALARGPQRGSNDPRVGAADEGGALPAAEPLRCVRLLPRGPPLQGTLRAPGGVYRTASDLARFDQAAQAIDDRPALLGWSRLTF